MLFSKDKEKKSGRQISLMSMTNHAVGIGTCTRDGGQGGVLVPRRVYIRKNVKIQKYDQVPGCHGCLAIATESNRSICHSSGCTTRVENAMRDNVFKSPRDGKVKWRQDGIWSWGQSSSSGAAAGSGGVPASRGTRRTAEGAGLPS